MSKDMMDTVRGRLGLVTDKFQQEQVLRLKAQAQQALNDIAQQLAALHLVEQYGSMPGYEGGKTGVEENNTGTSIWDTVIPNGFGILAGLNQLHSANRLDIKRTNVRDYTYNPYASVALQNLANIRISPYANMREMYDVERRNAYGLKNAGGLTAGQKYAAAVGAAIGTQNNLGKAHREIEALNNAHETAYNQASLLTGEGLVQRVLNAMQFDEEMFAKAHAAKVQNTLMGLRNFMDYLTQYAASEQKRKQYNKMLGMYEQSLVLDRDKLNQDIKYNNWQMDLAAKEKLKEDTQFKPTMFLTMTDESLYGLFGKKFNPLGNVDLLTRPFNNPYRTDYIPGVGFRSITLNPSATQSTVTPTPEPPKAKRTQRRRRSKQ